MNEQKSRGIKDTSQEQQSANYRQNDWPELKQSLQVPVPDQVLAKEIANDLAKTIHTPLKKRVKVLLIIMTLTLISAGQTAILTIPALLKASSSSTIGLALLVSALNILIQLSSAAYFYFAYDPDFASGLIKFLLVLNCVELYLGLFAFESLFTTLAIMILLIYANGQITLLKYDGK